LPFFLGMPFYPKLCKTFEEEKKEKIKDSTNFAMINQPSFLTL
jgi:hypothetical protein